VREELEPEVLWDHIAWSMDLLHNDDIELVRAARERYEPLMVKTLRDVASDPDRYADEAHHHGHQVALAFLAEFRAAAAFPAILEFLAAIRGFEAELLPGDMIIDDLPAILVSTFDGNLGAMKSFIANDGMDEFVKSAMLAAIAILAGRGEVDTSDEVVEALEDITLPSSNPRYGLVKDAVELIDTWEQLYWRPEFEDDGDEPDEDDDATWDDDDGTQSSDGPQVPFVRETPKVGRNEPCPCGSGKKYKNCCAA